MEEQAFSIWVKSSSDDVTNIKTQINSFAKEENKASFDPHVTLVTKINSQQKANDILDQIKKEKITVTFDRINEGRSYFQRLYLCLLYTSPSPRDKRQSRMPSSA